MECSLVFPHQLFELHPSIIKDRKVILIEEWLYFHQYPFHQQKLILHRASMQFYYKWLMNQGYTIEYIEAIQPNCKIENLILTLHQTGYSKVHYADVVDDWLEKKIQKTCRQYSISIQIYKTPAFLNEPKELESFFQKKRPYHQTDFYIDQRKKRNLLLDQHQAPVGGKWTYDEDNRLKLPAGEYIPISPYIEENSFVSEAKEYILTHFPKNVGNTRAPLDYGYYPSTFAEAKEWMNTFFKKRFVNYGVYQDAIVDNQTLLYHSLLTPLLNIGLLTPQQVINAALHASENYIIPINSLEGFIRQIVGWRELIRMMYLREGVQQRNANYFGFKRKIPSSFYDGTTGVYPIDTTIKKLLKTGYNHHIERLMILGNFMLLCEFDPNEVYRWFMEMYIDAYDWVMVSNVYGMSQFADGGLIATKPYISGSNYLMKMSNYTKGEWQPIWDALYWRFMHNHRTLLEKNPRISFQYGLLDKMDATKLSKHLKVANTFLEQLDKS